MISRAARRTRSERKSLSSPWPLINAFKRSRVRSDAGILSIGVLLRQRPVAKPNLVDSPNQATVHPNPFSSNPRTSPLPIGPDRTQLVGREQRIVAEVVDLVLAVGAVAQDHVGGGAGGRRRVRRDREEEAVGVTGFDEDAGHQPRVIDAPSLAQCVARRADGCISAAAVNI